MDSSSWVCALRVDFDDGTHNVRIIHRGSEAECEQLASLVPASHVEIDRSRLAPELRDMPPPEEIRVEVPPGKRALGAVVIVCREDRLES